MDKLIKLTATLVLPCNFQFTQYFQFSFAFRTKLTMHVLVLPWEHIQLPIILERIIVE